MTSTEKLDFHKKLTNFRELLQNMDDNIKEFFDCENELINKQKIEVGPYTME